MSKWAVHYQEPPPFSGALAIVVVDASKVQEALTKAGETFAKPTDGTIMKAEPLTPKLRQQLKESLTPENYKYLMSEGGYYLF